MCLSCKKVSFSSNLTCGVFSSLFQKSRSFNFTFGCTFSILSFNFSLQFYLCDISMIYESIIPILEIGEIVAKGSWNLLHKVPGDVSERAQRRSCFSGVPAQSTQHDPNNGLRLDSSKREFLPHLTKIPGRGIFWHCYGRFGLPCPSPSFLEKSCNALPIPATKTVCNSLSDE